VDQELLEQQGAIYRVEGVDDEASTAQSNNKKKRKQNGDDVSVTYCNPREHH
jgi:hypothetical protein